MYIYPARKVPAVVNLRPPEVYRALPASSEQVCAASEAQDRGGIPTVSLPCLSSQQREMTREHTKARARRAAKNLAQREMRTRRARGRAILRGKIFPDQIFRQQHISIKRLIDLSSILASRESNRVFRPVTTATVLRKAFMKHVRNRSTNVGGGISIARAALEGPSVSSGLLLSGKSSAWPRISFFRRGLHPSRPHVCQDKHDER